MNTFIQKIRNGLPKANVITFCVLFFVSVWRPAALFSFFTMSMVPVTILLIGSVFLYRVIYHTGLEYFLRKYKVYILLWGAYVTVCLVSLFLNKGRYESISEIIRYGLEPLIIFTCAMLLLFIFNHKQKEKLMGGNRVFLPWLMFLLVAVLGGWQFFDFESSRAISIHFIAAEYPLASNISSVYRINTDFGPIMALTVLVCLGFLRFTQDPRRQVHVWWILLVSVFFVAGVMSGSRNFILTLAIGLIPFLVVSFKRRKKTTASMVVLVVVSLHFVILSSPITSEKFGHIFPYIEKLNNQQVPLASDFVPVINDTSLSGRKELWNRAVELWSENKLFGVSGGVFRLMQTNNSDFVVNQLGGNTHNLFLQALVDGGTIGFVLMVILLLKLLSDAGSARLPVVCACLTSLMFDYYLDHSLPWIICSFWLISVFKGAESQTDNTTS